MPRRFSGQSFLCGRRGRRSGGSDGVRGGYGRRRREGHDSRSDRGHRRGRDGQNIRLPLRRRDGGGHARPRALRRKGRSGIRHAGEGEYGRPPRKAEAGVPLPRRHARLEPRMPVSRGEADRALPRAQGAGAAAVSARGDADGEGAGTEKDVRFLSAAPRRDGFSQDGEKPAGGGGISRRARGDGERISERPFSRQRRRARKEGVCADGEETASARSL